MRIIEYIAQDGQDTDGTPYNRSAGFTVNLAAPYYVTATYSGGVGIYDYYLTNDAHLDQFRTYDNIHLIAAGITLPLGFEIYSNKCKLKLCYYDGEDPVQLQGVGYDGLILPFANYEIPIDILVNPRDPVWTTPYRLSAEVVEMDDTPLRISMVNVPALLDGQSFEVAAFMKIAHNVHMF